MTNTKDYYLVKLLDRLNTLAPDAYIFISIWIGLICLTIGAISITAIVHFAPPDPNKAQEIPTSPAMSALKRELNRTSNDEMEKFYTGKIMELEERENSRRQIIINQNNASQAEKNK